MPEKIKQQLEMTDKLTDHEKAELAEEAAELTEQVSNLEASKKIAANNYKLEIEKKAEAISSKLALVRKGEKTHLEDCLIWLNHPEDGKKTITRLDLPEDWDELQTGIARSWETQMSEDDFQLFPETTELEEDIFERFGFKETDIVGVAESYSIIKEPDDMKFMGDDHTEEDWNELQGKLVLKFPSVKEASEFVSVMLEDNRPNEFFTRFGMTEDAEMLFVAVAELLGSPKHTEEVESTPEEPELELKNQAGEVISGDVEVPEDADPGDGTDQSMENADRNTEVE